MNFLRLYDLRRNGFKVFLQPGCRQLKEASSIRLVMFLFFLAGFAATEERILYGLVK